MLKRQFSLFTEKRQHRQQQFKLPLHCGAIAHPGRAASGAPLVYVCYFLSLSASATSMADS